MTVKASFEPRGKWVERKGGVKEYIVTLQVTMPGGRAFVPQRRDEVGLRAILNPDLHEAFDEAREKADAWYAAFNNTNPEARCGGGTAITTASGDDAMRAAAREAGIKVPTALRKGN